MSPVPSVCVSVVSVSAPNPKTALSDFNFTSLPNTASLTTDRPPSVCNEPSVVLVASVVSSVFIIPPAVKALDTSTKELAFKSMVTSPSIVSTPSADCCIKEATSPKVNLLVLLSVYPVPSVCVKVVSLSAPKPNTAESLSNFKSLLIKTAVDASISTVGAVICSSISALISN